MFAGQNVDCFSESPLRVILKFKLWLDKFISFANRAGLASGAAAIATDEIESKGTHRGIKERTVLDLVVAPPKLDESFLHNVFCVGGRLHPLPGEEQQPGSNFRKATLPILMAGQVLHDLFTVFILKTLPRGDFV